MRRGYVSGFILIVFLLFSSGSYAQGLFGFEGRVVASNGIHGVWGPSMPACQSALAAEITSLLTAGHSIISVQNCRPIVFEPPVRIIDFEKIRWPWPGPVCLSCPYFLDDRFIEVVFPAEQDRVRGLVEKFRIQDYNKALINLQKEFELERFEEEMFNLELKQQLRQK